VVIAYIGKFYYADISLNRLGYTVMERKKRIEILYILYKYTRGILVFNDDTLDVERAWVEGSVR